jgi:beta-glucosidase
MIKGLQGTEKDRYRMGEPGSDVGDEKLSLGKQGVIATAKHFIGDGGTDGGTDQGANSSTEATLINIHGQGYYGALEAGTQAVMASFNSWTNTQRGVAEGKIHGSKYLLNDVLKQKTGFDGLIVAD